MEDATQTADGFARESQERLTRAEQNGLRLALSIRSVIAGLAFVWYGIATFFFPGAEVRLVTVAALLGFFVIGAAHLRVIGTRWDRWWMKYAVYALDALVICSLFAVIPISRAEDVPQIISFRAYGIYYLFPLLAMACLSLSWRLVLWTGGMIVLGWWAAYLWVVRQMENTLSWADIPAAATRADYEAVFLSMDFIGRGNRIEESAMVLCTAVGLAFAVYRARAVFFAQLAAERDHRKERAVREKVAGLLGKYLPEEIAQKLIAQSTPLAPQRSYGTALVMDIAGFTRFASQHPPEDVIAVLDAFLAEASDVVTDAGGVVMTYMGDGFLVTFNAPVAVAEPAKAAITAAKGLLDVAQRHDFGVRVGIASGPLVTGTIGSDRRQSFTVYGETVNRAARLESACKAQAVAILMDAPSADAAGRDDLRPVGHLDLAGFAAPVPALTLPASPVAV